MMFECTVKLDESIALVQTSCSEEEFKAYRREAGNIMGLMWDVMNPLYKQYPELKPPQLK